MLSIDSEYTLLFKRFKYFNLFVELKANEAILIETTNLAALLDY